MTHTELFIRCRRRLVLGALLVAALAAPATAQETDARALAPARTQEALEAAVMFLKLPDIKGEATDARHRDEIEVLGFSMGAQQSGGTTAGAGAGRVTMQDLVIVKRVDKASPKLFLSCAKGTHIPEATLVVRRGRGDKQELVRYVLSGVVIKSVAQGSDGAVPTERISLSYSRFEVRYTPVNPKGAAGPVEQAGWDLKQNKGL